LLSAPVYYFKKGMDGKKLETAESSVLGIESAKSTYHVNFLLKLISMA
jgi:hypothetical protein